LERCSGPSGFSFDEFLLTGEYKANILRTQFDALGLIALSAALEWRRNGLSGRPGFPQAGQVKVERKSTANAVRSN
jgi:hypothetical protein